jgi:hypothetical protein
MTGFEIPRTLQIRIGGYSPVSRYEKLIDSRQQMDSAAGREGYARSFPKELAIRGHQCYELR